MQGRTGLVFYKLIKLFHRKLVYNLLSSYFTLCKVFVIYFLIPRQSTDTELTGALLPPPLPESLGRFGSHQREVRCCYFVLLRGLGQHRRRYHRYCAEMRELLEGGRSRSRHVYSPGQSKYEHVRKTNC